VALSRRRFLREVLSASAALYLGCTEAEDGADAQALEDQGESPLDAGPDAEVSPDFGADFGTDFGADLGADAGTACADGLAGATFEAVVPFVGDAVQFHTPRNAGWDGRLYTDLSLVDRNRLLTPIPEFYIRTLFPDRLDLAAHLPWQIAVEGLDAPTQLTLDDLLPLARPMGAHVLECSGNSRGAQFGLLSATEWTGIPLEAVWARLGRLPTDRVELGGFDDHSVPSANNHSTPGASWIFTLDQLRGAFLATGMGGAPLTLDHGFPVRLIVPGWYGCTCIKWLNLIRFVDDAAPATSQMVEFASRTHQTGVPALARDYQPAALDQAAMPVRLERWRRGGQTLVRVVGILWGGSQVTTELSIRFGADQPFVPVDVCPPMTGNALWTVFEHVWVPPGPGMATIRCAVAGVRTRRLDQGYYDRAVEL